MTSTLVNPMDEKELKEYQIEIEKDWWFDGTCEDKLEILDAVKDWTCKTDGSPIKKVLAFKWVLKNNQALLVDGTLLDLYSAGVINTVYKYLIDNKKKDFFFKLFNSNIVTIVNHCYKCLK